MAESNVCRLCMSGDDLIWIFDKHDAGSTSMKEIIRVTTGVEILEKDIISKKICKNCCTVTVKMFKFRERAVKTDKYLKDRCKDFLKSKETTIKIANTSVSIRTEKKPTCDVNKNNNSEVSGPKITIKPVSPSNKELKKIIKEHPNLVNKLDGKFPEKSSLISEISPHIKEPTKTKTKVHSSIDEIFSRYADIKLPSASLRLDMNPTVCMEMDLVEEYFHRHNLDMQKAVQKALKLARTPKTVSVKAENTKTHKRNEENKYKEISVVVERKVRPISIKLSSVDKTDFEVVDGKSTSQEDPSDSEDIPKPNKFKRRRLSSSSSDISVGSLPDKRSLMETLELKPKVYSFPQKCGICNIQGLNSKELMHHLQQHLSCRYCKTRFKTIELKEKHEKTCLVKHALHSRPYIPLVKVELCMNKTDRTPPTKLISEKTNTDLSWNEVIELSDDDDDDNPNDNVPYSSKEASPGLPTTSEINQPTLIPLATVEPAIQYSSTGIVKPIINIKDNYLLNTMDTTTSDSTILKELLTKYMPMNMNMKLSVDGNSQTDLPVNNNSIAKNASNLTATMKDLVPQLFVFKVPIETTRGDFNITYKESKKPEKKKVQLWIAANNIPLKTNSKTFRNHTFKKRVAEGIPLLRSAKNAYRPRKVISTSGNNPVTAINTLTTTSNISTPSNISTTNNNISTATTNISMPSSNISTATNNILSNDVNQSVPQNEILLPNINENFSNIYFASPTTPVLTSNTLQLTPSDVNTVAAYLPQESLSITNNVNVLSGNNSYLAAGQQNFNLSITCANTLLSNSLPTSINVPVLTNNPMDVIVGNSMPTLTSDIVYSAPSTSTVKTPPLNDFFRAQLAPPSYPSTSVHNNFKNLSSEQSTVVSDAQSSTAQRPLIRVRNLCDLT